MNIVFATNNEHKLREVRQILDGRYNVLSLSDINCHDDIPETADTLDGNALLKARFVNERYGVDVFADDTGLEVDALGGEPGVHTARYAADHGRQPAEGQSVSDANVDLLLENMRGKEDRAARFRTAIALIQNGKEHLFEGCVEGRITEGREGDGGFGYDPVFQPDGYEGTFATLGADTKNRISHRARAVQALVRFLSCLLLCVGMATGVSAQTIGTWTQVPAYGVATNVLPAGGQLWTVASGNLWAMDLETGEITTFDRLNDLNGINIQHIAYCEEVGCIVLGYENSIIDIIDAETHQVRSISGIANADEAQTTINDITIRGKEAWVATDFGVVRIDLDELYVIDTYKVDGGCRSVCVTDDTVSPLGDTNPSVPTLFMATPGGFYCVPMSANLHDTSQFKMQSSTTALQKLRWWKGTIVFTTESVFGYYQFKGGFKYPASSGIKKPTDIYDCGDRLLVAGSAGVWDVAPDMTAQRLLASSTPQSAALAGSTYYVAESRTGVVPYTLNGSTLKASGGAIKANGPVLDNVMTLRYSGKQLMVLSGERETCAYSQNAASYRDDSGTWHHLDLSKFASRKSNFRGLTDIAVDPRDPDHHYVSSHGHGVLEFQGTELINTYDASTSPLVTLIETQPSEYTWVEGMAYDSQNNLWMFNCLVDSTLACLKADGTWKKVCDLNNKTQYSCVAFALDGDRVWGASYESNGYGSLWAHDVSNGLSATTYQSLTQQDDLKYNIGRSESMAIDRDHRVWYGCRAGLFVVDNQDDYFRSGFKFTQIKVNRNDGSGLADYLLNGLWVTALAVDPANRKWVGTDGQGVYLISADGQQELLHFTTDNSPLPSDKIRSIAVCEVTGEVAIGTAHGVVTYMSNATETADELDADNIICFPNPVPDNYHGNVNIKGLTDGAEVKIATVSGQVIYRTHANGGMATWNCRDARGRRVATGVYNVIASSADGSEAAVTRIVVTN